MCMCVCFKYMCMCGWDVVKQSCLFLQLSEAFYGRILSLTEELKFLSTLWHPQQAVVLGLLVCDVWCLVRNPFRSCRSLNFTKNCCFFVRRSRKYLRHISFHELDRLSHSTNLLSAAYGASAAQYPSKFWAPNNYHTIINSRIL